MSSTISRLNDAGVEIVRCAHCGAQPTKIEAQAVSEKGEVHTIVVEGRAPNGMTYFAELDVVFPRGTKLTITERFSG